MQGSKVRGWVYVLTNEAFPHLLKIGFSLKDPILRAGELYSTGVPHPYKVGYEIFTYEPRTKEQEVHQRLAHTGHHENKEFFCCSLNYAVSIIREVCAGEVISEEKYDFIDDVELPAQDDDEDFLVEDELTTTDGGYPPGPDSGRNISKVMPYQGPPLNADPDLRGSAGYITDGQHIVHGKTILRVTCAGRLGSGLFEYQVIDEEGVHGRLVFNDRLTPQELLFKQTENRYHWILALSPSERQEQIQGVRDIVQIREMYLSLMRREPPKRDSKELISTYIEKLKAEMLLALL